MSFVNVVPLMRRGRFVENTHQPTSSGAKNNQTCLGVSGSSRRCGKRASIDPLERTMRVVHLHVLCRLAEALQVWVRTGPKIFPLLYSLKSARDAMYDTTRITDRHVARCS